MTGRPSSSARRWMAAAAAVYALGAVLFTFPLVMHLGDHVPGDITDPAYTLWLLSWNYHAAAGQGSFWTANIFYPHQGTLFYADPLFGLALLGLPVRLATSNPVILYNILFLFGLFLCGMGAFLLVRRLTGSPPAALLAGLIYAFFPYHFAHLSHLEIQYFGWIPLCLLFMHRFFEKPSWPNLAGMAVFYILQVLCCAYYGNFFTLFAGLFVLAWAVRTGLWRSRAFWIKAAVFVAVCAAVLAPVFIQFLRLHQRMAFVRPLWEVRNLSAQPQHYLAVPAGNAIWGKLTSALGGAEWQLFPGLAVLVLAALFVAQVRRRARSAAAAVPVRPMRLGWIWDALNGALAAGIAALAFFPSFRFSMPGLIITGSRLDGPILLLLLSVAARWLLDPSRRRRIRALIGAAGAVPVYYGAMALAAFLLSLGPEIRIFGRRIASGPYMLLYDFFPGYRSLRAPSRFSILVALGLAVLAAFAVGRFLAGRSGRGRILWTAGLGLAVAAEFVTVPVSLARIWDVPAIYKTVASLPKDASLIKLPMPTRDDFEWEEAVAVYFSSFHFHPIVNGYSGFAPPAYRIVREAMRTFPSRSAFDLLERLEVDYVLIRWSGVDEFRGRVKLKGMIRFRHRADPVAETPGFTLFKILPYWKERGRRTGPLKPVGDRRLWKARAGLNGAEARLAVDGDPGTAWTTGRPQRHDDWFELDLGRPETFNRVDFRLQSAPLDYPRHYRMEQSLDGRVWTFLDSGENSLPELDRATVEDFASYRSIVARVPARARYIRMILKAGVPERHWSISEADVGIE